MSQPLQREQDRSGYLSKDTIAALSAAPGGAIAIVRLSGPETRKILERLAGKHVSEAEPRKLVRAKLKDPASGETLDDALVARFIAPESFTGEDLAELHVHGSPFIATRVLECLSVLGARQALPGEFSFRAVRNGKLSITEAQGVADLISATNGPAVELALEKMSGNQGRLLGAVAESLKRLASMGELGIDFSDQDVDELSLARLKENLNAVIHSLTKLNESFGRGLLLQDGIRTAFLGLPNAGKSSLFNALLGEERSIVSEIPGTTRDVVRERLTLRSDEGSVTLRLEDTAGLRVSEDAIEKIGIARAEAAARNADLLLFLVDGSADIKPAIEQWRRMGLPAEKTLGILTKGDLPRKQATPQIKAAFSSFGIHQWAEISVLTGHGVSEAVDLIVRTCSRWTRREKGEILLTRLNQVEPVRQALAHLNRARGAPELDLFAADIRQSLHCLGSLIGETGADDILAQIFSDFCIGK